MKSATKEAIARFTRALGNPVSTPEWISAGNGTLERATYRMWRWRCPHCRGGFDDPDGLWRPLVIDSAGRVCCEAYDCSLEAIVREVQVLLEVERILDEIEFGVTR